MDKDLAIDNLRHKMCDIELRLSQQEIDLTIARKNISNLTNASQIALEAFENMIKMQEAVLKRIETLERNRYL